MFAGENQSLHASGFRRLHDLLRAEISWIENGFRLVAKTPFLVGEGIHGEMHEAVKLQLVPRKLARGRHRTKGRGRFDG
jgi:hypothetical protein